MRASRNQLIFLGALIVIALLLLPRFFSGGSSASPASTATTTTAAVKASTTPRNGRQAPQHPKLLPPTPDPALRHDLLAMGEGYQYDGSKCNIFASCGEIKIEKPQGNGTVATVDHSHDAPIVVPPPPIPLKFYGFATQVGQAKRVFLSSGDDVFVGTEGQVINKRYKIVKINPTSVVIEDILNNNTQPIPLTQQS